MGEISLPNIIKELSEGKDEGLQPNMFLKTSKTRFRGLQSVFEYVTRISDLNFEKSCTAFDYIEIVKKKI